jgi:beta-glucanase (GH16 family)
VKYESRPGAGDGAVRWWLDGAPLGSYTDLRFPDDAGLAEYQMSPTWGGVGDTKRQTDAYRFDHTYISVPRASRQP